MDPPLQCRPRQSPDEAERFIAEHQLDPAVLDIKLSLPDERRRFRAVDVAPAVVML